MVAAAQDAPRYETFLGYTYVRMNSATNVPAFSANGGDGQFALNFNKWLSGVVDLGAVHNGNIGGHHIDSTLANFLAGPRITWRKKHLAPYGQVLFGGVYATSSTQLQFTGPIVVPPIFLPGLGNVLDATSARVGASQTAFALTAGGGLDIKVSKHMSVRPIELDYYMTRLQNYRSADDNNQHNLRYMAGVNFTFGAQ
jgi:opacity protein-like surface antigen